jgi:transcription initiation factor TFIID subunit 7
MDEPNQPVKRPSLKLTIKKQPNTSQEPVPTPSTGGPKLKLKLSTPKPTPASETPPASALSLKLKLSTPKADGESSKKGKKGQPLKLNASKKRVYTAANDEGIVASPLHTGPLTSTGGGPKIKLKLGSGSKPLKTPTTPHIKFKQKGKPPVRPLGVGYDSEASDREVDPMIEEEFMLRMVPGEDCEYIRKAIENRMMGPDGKRADVKIRFFDREGRRCMIIVRGRPYAASVVDLPCIVEGMKSWDRKSWWKTADINQMMLVHGPVKNEKEAMDYPLPGPELDKETWAYAHGLTPPMRWVRKRRFRKRMSTKAIEAVEQELERLIRADQESVGQVKYELVDLDRVSRGASTRVQEYEEEYGDEDAEGDMEEEQDYFQGAMEEQDEDAMVADLEAAMMEPSTDELGEAETPVESSTLEDSAMRGVIESEAETPAAGTTSKEDSGDDESASEEEDDDVAEVGGEAAEAAADLQRQREEIEDLEAAIQGQMAEMEKLTNPLLRRKKMQKIQSLRDDLELKKKAIGEGEED